MHFALPVLLLAAQATVQSPAGPAVLEGRFGRAEVDAARPALLSLTLRRPGGALEQHSILAPIGSPWPRGVAGWAQGGYTYAVDAAGKRYESRHLPPDRVVASAPGKLVLEGVKLTAGPGGKPVATERWTLSTVGGDLSWSVERRWLVPFAARLAGTPGLFSSFRRATDAELLPNSVTHTLWVQPDGLRSWLDPTYRAWPADYKLSLENCAVVAKPDTWAVAKLWTSWHAEADPRLEVKGGHLYRRGFFGWRAELGAVSSPVMPRNYRAGEVERVTLTVAAVDKRATGYQLVAQIPDKEVQGALQSFYGSLLNGGVVNDQKHFNFGNETDGWYYDGSTWMQGLALAAGVPAAGKTAREPYDVASAFRGHLAAILGTLDPVGRGNFGYDWGGGFADARLNNVTGAREYLLHTGDLAFIRQILPDLERGVGWFLARRNAQGLADLGEVAHWYYDAMPSSGVNANHNALLYRACRQMAEMEAAAGHADRSRMYTRVADEVRSAFNATLWNEEAPGGPRITDWIAHSGEKVTYAADVCQFPAVAFGMVPQDRARRLLATLDRRIAELERDYGYTGSASLSAYWPVPDHINGLAWQRAFPIYMNCGSFLAITYYEIMARIEAGDVDGAWERMRRFSQGIRRHSGAGNNWVTVKGEVAAGADEPYLSDMVVVPAALVRGFLGIEPTWDRLVVRPHLPKGWRRASAEILYKGVRTRVEIEGEQVTVTPLGRAFTPAKSLTWEVRAAPPAEWQMTVSRHFANGATPPQVGAGIDLHGGSAVTLKRLRPAPGLVGLWAMNGQGALGAEGPVAFGQPGPLPGVPSARFEGQSHLSAPNPGAFSFGPKESFTLQCRLKAATQESQVLVSRPNAYCLYVKGGKLAAWIMQDGVAHREALGSAPAADGVWHHAAAVYDRRTQKLALYLDGRLDTPDGLPSPSNPMDISPIGLSSSGAPVSIGGLGQGFRFVGSIADVRIHAGALDPSELSYPAPRAETVPEPRLAARGEYTSSVCDWGQAATPQAVEVDCAPNGGQVSAVVECSVDRFKTVGKRAPVPITPAGSAAPAGVGAWRFMRVKLTLTAAAGGFRTPEVTGIRLRALPER
ncbi:MAG: hypothetical protein NT029_02815 [Armatimonadetes bacterium]|nr:hypothetical protein [Armatimonadota bacterium]